MMKPTPSAKFIRSLLLPGTVVAVMEAYYIAHSYIAHSPPHEQRRRIFFAIVILATFVVIAVLSTRKQTLSPENPRISPFILVGIALVIIVVAVLFRHV